MICCSASLSSAAHSQLLLLSRKFSSFSHIQSSLSLSLQQQPIHLCSSALYRFTTCRGFPCVSQLQLQFPFLSFFLLLFACQHSPWFSKLALCMPPLRMPHHATLCSSCLNCQSNFRLKFLPPSRVIRETQLEKSSRLVKQMKDHHKNLRIEQC
jgi:hypothetical protein